MALASLPLLMSLVIPVTRYGDASDYVMMAMSIGHDGDLTYDAVDLERVMASRPPGTDYPAGMFLLRDSAGSLHVGGHSFYYPLLAVPFCLLLGFRGFGVLNGLLLGGSIVLVARSVSPEHRTGGWAWAVSGVCCSAAIDYTIWPMAETWLLFLSTAFICAYRRRAFWIAGGLLGLGAATHAPMALWAALPAVDCLRRRIRPLDILVLGGCTLMMAAPQAVYNLRVSGVLHPAWLDLRTASRFLYYPVAFPGQEQFDRASHTVTFTRFPRLGHISLRDVVAALVSPKMGLVWFYPLVLLAAVRMWRERRGGATLAAAGLVLVAFCTAGSLSSHQVGLRYLNPVYPAFLLGFQTFRWDRLERVLLVIGLLLGLTFVLFPRANSSELISQKAVLTALLYR